MMGRAASIVSIVSQELYSSPRANVARGGCTGRFVSVMVELPHQYPPSPSPPVSLSPLVGIAVHPAEAKEHTGPGGEDTAAGAGQRREDHPAETAGVRGHQPHHPHTGEETHTPPPPPSKAPHGQERGKITAGWWDKTLLEFQGEQLCSFLNLNIEAHRHLDDTTGAG